MRPALVLAVATALVFSACKPREHEGAASDSGAGIDGGASFPILMEHPCDFIKPPDEVSPTFAAMWSPPALALEKDCNGGDAKACSHLARLAMSGIGLPHDNVRARALYGWAAQHGDPDAWLKLVHDELQSTSTIIGKKACESGSDEGCAFWAKAVQGVLESPAEIALANAAAKRACDHGSIAACNAVADAMAGLSKSPSAAVLDLRKATADQEAAACAAKKTDACIAIGSRDLCWGGCSEQDVRRPRASAAYKTACDAGDQRGCVGLALLAHLEGDDPKANVIERAVGAVCVKGDLDACEALSTSVGHERVPADVQIALCNANVGPACADLVRNTKTADVLARACLLGQGTCGGAGEVILGEPIDKSKDPRALTWLTLECMQNGVIWSGEGCEALSERDEVKACSATVLERWCAAGTRNNEACYGAAIAFETGTGTPKDDVRAAKAYAAACTLDSENVGGRPFSSACRTLADWTDQGRGVAKDPLRATELYAIGCSAQDDASCKILRTRLKGKK